MDVKTLINNQGFLHISEKIILLLDKKSILECRMVNSSWKNIIDNPIFWVKKCDQKGISKDLHNVLIDTIQKITDSELRQEAAVCLSMFHSAGYWTPENSAGLTLIYLASSYGFVKLLKFLATLVDNPNAPKSNGMTPLHSAAKNGHLKIVEFLAPLVDNPNAGGIGVTPLQLASRNGHTEVAKVLLKILSEKISSNQQDILYTLR